jgi:hypothetical protein
MRTSWASQGRWFQHPMVRGMPRTMHFLLSHGTIGVRKLLKELTRPSVGCPTHRPRRRPLGKGDEFRYGSDLHFLHTLWRWALTVRSVAPNASARCLLVLPRTTSSKTWQTTRSTGAALYLSEMATLLMRRNSSKPARPPSLPTPLIPIPPNGRCAARFGAPLISTSPASSSAAIR